MIYPPPADVVREVRRQVGGLSLAAIEDACQDAWLALLRSGHQFDEKTAYWYLVRSAVRGCWKQYRQQLRTPTEVSELEPDHRHDVVSLVIARDRLRLEGANHRQRRLLWLKASGYSYHEISSITGDTVRAVERQLLRGRDALAA